MAIVNHGRCFQVLLRCKFAQPVTAAITKTGPSQTLGSGFAEPGEILNVAHTFYTGFLPDQYRGTAVGGTDAGFSKTGSAAAIEKPSVTYG